MNLRRQLGCLQAYPKEQAEIQSLLDDLQGLHDAGLIGEYDYAASLQLLKHATDHLLQVDLLTQRAEQSLSLAEGMSRQVALLASASGSGDAEADAWGAKHTFQPFGDPISHITAIVVDRPTRVTADGQTFTRYRIVVRSEMPGARRYFVTHKRFNDFRALHGLLSGGIVRRRGLPNLPPYRTVFQGSFDPLFVEDRRKRLVDYLRALSADPLIVRSREFQEFLFGDAHWRPVEQGYS
ncbi:PX domain-containing protein [Giardia muris]|uniref:PX domain-containing protein n=1 Tax=Giardia muris TaxID=5742 RepID=A0A4Z1T140_GIAMU|nr:PX domain-containing protein [Giardia muris]|eukprot:TNJ26637.1 PX domain-containing protein [Giardia muris]